LIDAPPPQQLTAPVGDVRPLPGGAFEVVELFGDLGIRALVTTRAAGDFNLGGAEPVAQVMGRWASLRATIGASGPASRFATATQVHGNRILIHQPGWEGWLRADAADGHFSAARGVGFGVTVADCVPVFLAHPAGATALVHAGWRGTAGGIVTAALAVFRQQGLAPAAVRVHLGPAICGKCYEVGTEVYAELTHRQPSGSRCVDLRALLADQARAAGVVTVTSSSACTRCNNDTFYSHRAGDAGRQVASIMALDRSVALT
jgi:YfiH family protein